MLPIKSTRSFILQQIKFSRRYYWVLDETDMKMETTIWTHFILESESMGMLKDGGNNLIFM